MTVTVIQEIQDERRRQIEEERWTPGHDDHHRNGEMAGAAACYVMHGLRIGAIDLSASVKGMVGNLWPWATHYWKPTDRRRDLIKAAALLVAEIERLDRVTHPSRIGAADGDGE